MPRIGVEDRDDFGLGLPICNIANNKPHVKQRGCKISFERERGDVEDGLDLCQLHGDIYVNCSFWFEHFETPFLTPTVSGAQGKGARWVPTPRLADRR